MGGGREKAEVRRCSGKRPTSFSNERWWPEDAGPDFLILEGTAKLEVDFGNWGARLK